MTQAKRAREQALREKRERKQAKKADAAARKAAGEAPAHETIPEPGPDDPNAAGAEPPADPD